MVLHGQKFTPSRVHSPFPSSASSGIFWTQNTCHSSSAAGCQSAQSASNRPPPTHPSPMPIAWGGVLAVTNQQQVPLVGWDRRQFQMCFVLNGQKPIVYKAMHLTDVYTRPIALCRRVCKRMGRNNAQAQQKNICMLTLNLSPFSYSIFHLSFSFFLTFCIPVPLSSRSKNKTSSN